MAKPKKGKRDGGTRPSTSGSEAGSIIISDDAAPESLHEAGTAPLGGTIVETGSNGNGAHSGDEGNVVINADSSEGDDSGEIEVEVKRPIVTVPPHLEPIVERLRAGRCVLCAGAGFEAAIGMPSFRELLEMLLGQLGSSPETNEARAVLEHRPLVAAGFVRRRLGDRFNMLLQGGALTPKELPETVRTLGELPFRAIVTTSYSNLFARAFTKNGNPPPVYTPTDVAQLKHDARNRYVLMMLGDPARDETVLFTQQEIQAALSDDGYRRVVHDLYRNRSIVFLGFSAEDLEMLFGRLFAGVKTEQTHWAVFPTLSKVEGEELETALRITPLVEQDLPRMVKQLREAIGDFDADAPPDDDDLEGWLELLTQEPGRADGLAKLGELQKKLEAAGDHDRLLDLHLGLAEVEQSHAARAGHLREVSRLFETTVGDLAKAFTALVAAYREDPVDALATDLERLAAATGMWAELLKEYSEIVPALAQTARAAHWLRVARLYADKLGHDEYALGALDEALKVEPHHAEAEGLRIDLLRRVQKWRLLADALGARADHEAEAARKGELYLEQGDVLESRLSDGPGAAAAYRRALAVEPQSRDALSALEHLHRRAGEYGSLIGVLDQKIQAAGGEEALALRKEAAALAADKLGDRKAAIERYEALRADDEKDLGVLAALENLYLAEGRVEDYLETLAAEARATTEDKGRLTLLRRLGQEWEDRPHVGTQRAAEYFEQVLAIDPKAEDALLAVERLYALDKKWEALVDAYRRHAELQGADKVTLHAYVGQVFENEIGDSSRAITAWREVLDLAPAHDDALAALTRLYRKTEQWPDVLNLLDKRAEQSTDMEMKVALYHEAATLAADKIGDAKAAETRHARTLSADPLHVPSMLALVELYRKSGEFLRAAKLLVEAEQHTQNRLEKTRILVEAGEIYDSLEDHHMAADLYLRALAVDPEHVEAGARVAEILWKAERFADLVPVLEMLTRKEGDRETQRTRWSRLGRAATRIGNKEKALKAYSKAAELDPKDLEAQRARATLFDDAQRWAEAREAYAAMLTHHADDLMPKERLEVFFRLGEAYRHLGEVEKAREQYTSALAIDPTHRPTILARIDVGSDDPAKLIEDKKALLVTASREESAQLLSQIGELYADKLTQPDEALKFFKEALALNPAQRNLLHRCLDILVEKKDWKAALEVLEKLTDQEQVASIRAKLRFTRAMIAKDELGDKEAAIVLLGEALDDDAHATAAASELEDLLVKTESWKEYARFLRKAIKRLGPDVDADTPETRKERLRLWSMFGEITLEKLGERMSALAALEVAATFDRGNLKRQEQLAELYVEAGPEALDKAIAVHQSLLRNQHDRVASIRALRQLYGQTRAQEKALACAYALSILKKGDPDDAPMIAEAKQRPLQPMRRNLDDEMWLRNVTHPDENPVVDALFAALMPTVAVANGRGHKELGFNRKDKIDATDPRSFAKGMRYVAAALDVRLSYECYVKYEQRAAVTIVNAVDKMTAVPCVVVGQPLLGEQRKQTERELIFEWCKHLATLRPERYLKIVLPSAAALGNLIDAAILLGSEADGGKGAPAASPDVARRGQELKRALPPKTLEQVVFYGKKLKGQRGEAMAATWLAATELTATRAAFLLLGDLEQTARHVAGEPPSVSPHPPTYRLKELIWFSVTEECFAARRHLGVMS